MKPPTASPAADQDAIGTRVIGRLLEQIRSAREQLGRFNRVDLPAYDDWMAARFRTLLDSTRELRARADEIQEDLDRIDALAFEMNLPHHRAYSRLFDKYVGPEWFAEEVGLRLSDIESDEAGDDEDAEDDPYHDQLVEAFAELLGPYADPDEETAVVAAREERMRICYRQLARRLHPDHRQSGDGGPWVELWHQAQEAYNQGDVSRLEVLLTLTEVEAGDIPQPRDRDEAAAVIKKLRHTLAHLAHQLDTATGHDAWDFASRADRAEIEASFERERLRERLTLQKQVLSLERKLRRWSRPPRLRRLSPLPPPFPLTRRHRTGEWVQLEFPFVRELDHIHAILRN